MTIENGVQIKLHEKTHRRGPWQNIKAGFLWKTAPTSSRDALASYFTWHVASQIKRSLYIQGSH